MTEEVDTGRRHFLTVATVATGAVGAAFVAVPFLASPEYLVLVGVCTHLGCAPLDKFAPGDVTVGADWPGGFFCPCHGSKFDMSGRVFKDVPAPTNLPVPPYQFVNDTRILIGAEKGNA